MRSVTLKRIILIICISISALVCLQVYWLNKQYSFEQQLFSSNVLKAIRGFYEDFGSKNGLNITAAVEQPVKHGFLFNINDIATAERFLADSLISELRQANINGGYRLLIHKYGSADYGYSVLIGPEGQRSLLTSEQAGAPLQRPFSYICIVFTNPGYYVFTQMTWLILLSIMLILLVCSLGVSLFYLYKQKFLVETQNDFIRNITHEFQTPLATLLIGIDSLNKPAVYQQAEKRVKYISLMHAQVEYLNQHILNLVNSVKAGHIDMHMHKEPCCINAMIREAIMQLSVSIEEKNAEVILHTEQSNQLVSADANLLFVVFINLISNAIKFAPQPVIQISTANTGNGYYTISVQDNGIGIDTGDQKRIFEKFYRVATGNTHNVKGLGLGLYFVKRIVTAHKGTISVKSEPGNGTAFIIQLPLKK